MVKIDFENLTLIKESERKLSFDNEGMSIHPDEYGLPDTPFNYTTILILEMFEGEIVYETKG